MKKLLLGLAVLLPAMAANAQEFTEFFKVTYNGQELSNGQTVYILPASAEEVKEEGYIVEEGKVTYLPHIHVINLEEDPRQMHGTLEYDNPSYEYFINHQNDEDFIYGHPSMCFSGGLQPDLVTTANNCLNASPGNAGIGTVIVPEAGKDTFSWDIHLEDADPEATTTLKMELIAQDGYAELAQDFSEPFYITLVYSTKDTGVDEIGLDANAPVEYYDLQGRKITNPGKGLYIVKQGAKAEKHIVL